MRKLVTVGVVCAVLATGWASASAVSAASGRTDLVGSHPAWAKPANRVGGVASTAGITVRVYLRGRDDAGLEAVARSVSDPKSSSYHHFLSVSDVRARFTPAQATIDSVRSWLSGWAPQRRSRRPSGFSSGPTGCAA